MILTKDQARLQRVVCAAARIDINRIIVSPRHHDALFRATVDMLPEADRDEWKFAEQGFVDQFGNFLTREEAREIAVRHNQIIHRCGGDEVKLYTENLY